MYSMRLRGGGNCDPTVLILDNFDKRWKSERTRPKFGLQ